ncbi:hypothetical protein M569_02674, partial [Genlisea aurea]
AIDANKLSYRIFSILETKFLFGYDAPPKPRKSLAPPPPEYAADRRSGRRVCVLSVDSGGMRNITSGKALAYLERSLKAKSGNSEARIADYFDVAAGSGVGGVFAAMLFAAGGGPVYAADDTWKFLAAHGKEFCAAPTKRGFLKRAFEKSTGGGGGVSLEKALKEAFTDGRTGRTLTLKNAVKPLLIPCYDLSTAAPFLFSRADAMESDSYDFRLWEVCLATSADAGVFAPVGMKSIDGQTQCTAVGGGIAMSNPTAAAITHVLHNKQDFPQARHVDDILVLSLGAGCQLTEGSFDRRQVKKWNTAKDWSRPIARISGDASAELVDHAAAMAFAHGGRSTNYVRIQASGSSSPDRDTDWSAGNVKTLTEAGDEMLKQKSVEAVMLGGRRIGEKTNAELLDWFAEELVAEHRRR